MRLLSIIIVGFAVTILLATLLERAGSAGEALESSFFNEIRVTGPDNTLSSIAQRVNDPKRFMYDSATRTAVSYATLVVEGELQLGLQDDPHSGEYLEMATQTCGGLRIEVSPEGVLRLYYSTLRTVSQVLTSHGPQSNQLYFRQHQPMPPKGISSNHPPFGIFLLRRQRLKLH